MVGSGESVGTVLGGPLPPTVAPKPVPYNTMVSPAAAGLVVVLAPRKPAGAMICPDTCSAAIYILPVAATVPIVKKDGAINATVAFTAALGSPLLVTWICVGPGETPSGTRKLI